MNIQAITYSPQNLLKGKKIPAKNKRNDYNPAFKSLSEHLGRQTIGLDLRDILDKTDLMGAAMETMYSGGGSVLQKEKIRHINRRLFEQCFNSDRTSIERYLLRLEKEFVPEQTVKSVAKGGLFSSLGDKFFGGVKKLAGPVAVVYDMAKYFENLRLYGLTAQDSLELVNQNHIIRTSFPDAQRNSLLAKFPNLSIEEISSVDQRKIECLVSVIKQESAIGMIIRQQMVDLNMIRSLILKILK